MSEPTEREWLEGLRYEDKFPDRAPGEVEAVARALWASDGPTPWEHASAAAKALLMLRAKAAIAALDAVRGRSRDDTAMLRAHADALAAWVELLCEQVDSTPALMEVGRYRSWVEARFGAGRADRASEDER